MTPKVVHYFPTQSRSRVKSCRPRRRTVFSCPSVPQSLFFWVQLVRWGFAASAAAECQVLTERYGCTPYSWSSSSDQERVYFFKFNNRSVPSLPCPNSHVPIPDKWKKQQQMKKLSFECPTAGLWVRRLWYTRSSGSLHISTFVPEELNPEFRMMQYDTTVA